MLFLSGRHGGSDCLGCPFWLFTQHVLREPVGLFDAHAAVTQPALDTVEQLGRVRIVEIDVEVVRENNFTPPRALPLPGRWRMRRAPGFDQSTEDGSTTSPDALTTSMLFRSRNPGSRVARGIVSSFAMPAGTFQYGLKTTCVIESAKMGVLLSGSPTTTRIASTGLPFSIASRRKSGTFTMKCRACMGSGSQRHRSRFSSIVRMRCSTGTFSAVTVAASTMPSGLMRWRSSNRLTAAIVILVEDGAWIVFAGRIEVALHRESVAQHRHHGRLLIRLEPRVGGNRRPAPLLPRSRGSASTLSEAHDTRAVAAASAPSRPGSFFCTAVVSALTRSGLSGFKVHSDCKARGSRRPPSRWVWYTRNVAVVRASTSGACSGEILASFSGLAADRQRIEARRKAVVVGGGQCLRKCAVSRRTDDRRQSR